MPELPEVETVRRGLEKIFSQCNVVHAVELRRSDLRVAIPPALPQLIAGKPVLSVRRRAKYLLLDFPEHTMISHLGMTGTWRLVAGEEKPHDHVYLTLADGTRLAFNDPRRFGVLDLVAKASWQKSPWLEHLGVEPLGPELTADFLWERARGRKVAVKNFIMDQRVVVGVGNIYASESLFLAGLKPTRSATRVTREGWQAWVKAIRRVLQASIRSGGTTLRDYRSFEGQPGGFQRLLHVYDRGGEDCRSCETKIKMNVIGGRSTYWCPSCQK